MTANHVKQFGKIIGQMLILCIETVLRRKKETAVANVKRNENEALSLGF